MTQTLDIISRDSKRQILCGYRNQSTQVQIARISNIAGWYFERVVFPGQLLLFASLSEAQLEIYAGSNVSSILADKIPCTYLQIDDFAMN